MSKENVKKLSKGLLELKFMKRTKEKVEKQEEDEERQHLYQDNLIKLDEDVNKVIHLVSYYDCKEFLPCRLSFGGFDPEIEKINEDVLTGIYKVEKKATPQEPEADVPAADVMESSFGVKIGEKFNKGPSRNNGPRLGQKRHSDGDNSGPRFGEKRWSDGDNSGPRFGQKRGGKGDNSSPRFGQKRWNDGDNSGPTFGQKRRSDGDNSGPRFGQKRWSDGDNSGPKFGQKRRSDEDNSKSKFLKPSDD